MKTKNENEKFLDRDFRKAMINLIDKNFSKLSEKIKFND